jgi:sirohydrochlorin cobaltochelatase
MSLEWRQDHGHHHGGGGGAGGRAAELDATIRGWPRRADNDPYKAGLERVADALRSLLPTDLLVIGYNEFCRPTIAEAVAQVIGQGAGRVLVIPSMLTPGGVHAERDIPKALEEIRRSHTGVTIDYLWPFDLRDVASLLASHVRKACLRPAGAGQAGAPQRHV